MRPVVDLRLVAPLLTLWVTQAVTLTYGLHIGTAIAMVWCGVVGWCLWKWFRAPAATWITLFAIGLCAGSAVLTASLRSSSLEVPIIESLIATGDRAQVTVQFTEPLRMSRVGAALISPDHSAEDRVRWSGRVTVLAIATPTETSDLNVPARLAGFGAARFAESVVPGASYELPATAAMASHPSVAADLTARGSPTLREPAPPPQQLASQIRRGLADSTHGLDSATAGLLPGLVVGDESALDPGLRDDMRATGLSHLTAVSGANIAIVAGAVLIIARLLRIRRSWAALCAWLVVMGYIGVVGPQPSVLRAGAMATIMLAALGTGRTRSAMSVLLVSALVLLLVDPWLSISLGFALSVVATAALLIAATLPGDRSGWRAYVRGALLACSAASFATLPLIASIGNGLPLASPVANALAMPAVAPATVLGFTATVLAWVHPTLAAIFAAVAGYPTGWIANVAAFFADRPGSVVPFPGGWVGAGGALAIVIVSAWLVQRPQLRAALRGRPVKMLACLILVVWVTPLFETRWLPSDWLLVACDVGQGDSLVVRAGDGAAIVVDVGPDPRAVDQCLTELAVTRISLLVLTHFHADHVGGLAGAVTNRTVDRVVVSPLAEPAGTAQATSTALVAAVGEFETAQLAESGKVGDATYTIVWPAESGAPTESAANNASVALIVSIAGVDVLFTGDMEPSTQAKLNTTTKLGDIDVVKVPHHGSRYQDAGLMDALAGAQVALVSVGASNRYGHPAPETVRAWHSRGVPVYRTDTMGHLALVRSPSGELEVYTSRPSES